jgi:AraC family transcriptional regulator
LTFHPPEERHSQKIQSNSSSSFNIEIHPALLLRLQSYSAQPLEPCAIQASPVINLTLRLQNEFEQNDTVSPLVVEGLSLALLAELMRLRRTEKAVPKWLLRVRSLLHDRFHCTLDLATLAHEAGVHPVYLVQRFRRQFHCTPGEYQRQLRVDAAKEKLASSTCTLSEIALLTGFADQSHLTRIFKRNTGMTPAEFRRTARA